MNKERRKKFWLWFKSTFFYYCPKCGYSTKGSAYGEYCLDKKDCGWIQNEKT